MLGSVPLVKYGPPPKTRAMRSLLGDIGIGVGADGGSAGGAEAGGAASGAAIAAADKGRPAGESGGGGGPHSTSSGAKSRKGNYISFWKPEVREE